MSNPLNSELQAAYDEGFDAVMRYLAAINSEKVVLREAKLILVGEGEVGKSCLLGALRGDPWIEKRPTTHGIEILPVEILCPQGGDKITLNGWDFGGQPVYRPTHQLFFSAPAVYLVIWKPREGARQDLVKEWIQLVKRREPDAKILVVATHGGPMQRQPDIDKQEIWDAFGRDTVIDFFHVESKADQRGVCSGIEELKEAIFSVVTKQPGFDDPAPKRWQEVREALEQTKKPYLPLTEVNDVCRKHGMDEAESSLYLKLSHRLGHLIHYREDPILRDIVVLKPDWLATAISYILDDGETRKAHGLVKLSRLSQIWDDPTRDASSRYPAKLHRIFLSLMERFDLSYQVAKTSSKLETDPESLIGQLVPDIRPEPDILREWSTTLAEGDLEQYQICQIVDRDSGQSANAEGLFYQLIVRLHRYSLGRDNFGRSVHWQRGIILDAGYNGRALLEHTGNDIRISVRAPFPSHLMSILTEEVKGQVESFWEGLLCNVMVPCIEPCGKQSPGKGRYEVEKLIDSLRRNRTEQSCPTCNEGQDIHCLLRNAPSASAKSYPSEIAQELLLAVREIAPLIRANHGDLMFRFDHVDSKQKEILSQIDAKYSGLAENFCR